MRRSAKRARGLTASQRQEMDDLARTIVMLRAGARLEGRQTDAGRVYYVWVGRCQWCDKHRDLQWCHIYSRGAHPSLRWNPDNAFAGCAYCHKFRWHDNPEGERRNREEFLDRILGSKRTLLDTLAHVRGLKTDYQATLLWLRQAVKNLGETP